MFDEELDERDQEIIKIIDKAEYIGGFGIRSRFGNIMHLSSLSSGAKIALLIKKIKHNLKVEGFKYYKLLKSESLIFV